MFLLIAAGRPDLRFSSPAVRHGRGMNQGMTLRLPVVTVVAIGSWLRRDLRGAPAERGGTRQQGV